MPDLQPYVEAKDYIRAHTLVRGQQRDVVVLGWRGDRVYATWRGEQGRHLGWVPAADVERRSAGRAPALTGGAAGRTRHRRKREVPSA